MRIKIPFFKRIDTYIFTEIAGPFVGGMVFFVFVFLMFQVLRLAEFFIERGIPGSVLAKMTGLLIVSFLPMALPISFLVAILVAFGRLSADSEIVAIKASGISMNRVAVPAMAAALIVSVLSLMLGTEWVPWSERTFKSTLMRASNTKVVSSIREGTFTSDFFDLLFFAEKVDSESGEVKRVFIFDEREPKAPFAVVAKSGKLLPVQTESEFAASLMLQLKDGSIHQADPGAETYHRINFREDRIFLNITEGSDTSVTKPKTFTSSELRKKIETLPQTSPFRREATTEIWRRLSVALSPMLFVFLGIGFGTVRTRSVKAGAVLIAFAVVLVYYAVQTWATALAYGGKLPPAAAMQLPNLLILAAGIWGFRQARW